MILHAETLYSNTDYIRNEKDEKAWEEFVSLLATQAGGIKIEATPVAAATTSNNTMDSQILKTIIQHLQRFSNIQTKPLLNILTQTETK